MKNTSVDTPSADETCFVICPIGDEDSETRVRSDKVLDFIISPALNSSGLAPLRSDRIAAPGMITTQVIDHILKDKLVVADLSDHNPNVFYELALRHAFRKPVIQLVSAGQKLPFDILGLRTIYYTLDLEGATRARDELSNAIQAVLATNYEVESPVTIAAKLEDLSRSAQPESQAIMQSMIRQIDALGLKLDEIAGTVCRTDDYKETIPPIIKDQIESILQRYEEEIHLLQSVRYAGVTGIFKRREMAVRSFATALDQESKDIMIIGSSLKGLLQKDEYSDIKDKIRFKIQNNLTTDVKFLLTHPIVADFRANQENRRPGEIGEEILSSLKVLWEWGVNCRNVRLYLGTPTCFAIKTARQMLINPYPYISVSFDSPCLHVEYSSSGGADRPGYFYDEFNSRHFGAWDTDMAVHIDDFGTEIDYYRAKLPEYSAFAEEMIRKGRETS